MVDTAPSPRRPRTPPQSPMIVPTRRQSPASALILSIASLWLAAFAYGPAAAQDGTQRSGAAPLPRFVSLKSDEVNLRTGPGKRYPIDWIYRRRGLPVEIIDEFEDWRRVRDHDGTIGWVHRFMLASHRTVLVTGETRVLRRRPSAAAPGMAYLEAGVVAELEDCEGAWCRIEAQGFDGWLQRNEIFGTNADD